jgi:hypothetical protein
MFKIQWKEEVNKMSLEGTIRREASWRVGHHYFSSQDPQAVFDCLQKVQAIYGNRKPSSVVEWAEKNPNTALWRCFEWDNAVAGNKWRLRQAGVLMASIYVTVLRSEPKIVNVTIQKVAKESKSVSEQPQKRPERIPHYEVPICEGPLMGVQGEGPFDPMQIAEDDGIAYRIIDSCRKTIRAAYDRIRTVEQLRDSWPELAPHFDEIDRVLMTQAIATQAAASPKKAGRPRKQQASSSPPA